MEVLRGFAPGGPLGLHAKRIKKSELLNAANEAFRTSLYGSGRSVRAGGAYFEGKGEREDVEQSIIGYSPTHIVFLTSEGAYTLRTLDATLANFSVTDAVRNDGGNSVGMHIAGEVDKNLDPTEGWTRCVAYAIGLVPRADGGGGGGNAGGGAGGAPPAPPAPPEPPRPPPTSELPPRVGCVYIQHCNYPDHAAGTVCRTYPGCSISDAAIAECRQDIQTVCGSTTPPAVLCDRTSSDCRSL